MSRHLVNGIAPTLAEAASLDRAAGTWFIVAGADRTLPAAEHEVNKARDADAASVFEKDGWFRTIVGPFPSRTEAESASIVGAPRFAAAHTW